MELTNIKKIRQKWQLPPWSQAKSGKPKLSEHLQKYL